MKQFVLIGHPLGHSLSPQIHSAGYAALGLDCKYSLADCPTEASVAAQIDRLRGGQISGANVTVPWKKLALSLADSADSSASRTGAANVLALGKDGGVRAFNTDAPALAALLRGARNGLTTGTAVVLGGGGAALAAVVACRQAGATDVVVSARKFDPALPKAAWPAASQFEAIGASVCSWNSEGELRAHLLRSQIVVQCTSAGMLGASSGEGLARMVPFQKLLPEARIFDVVYNPAVTPFLRAATEAGLVAEGGLSMLVGQAALAFEIWLGVGAPVAQMREAAERALSGGED